MSELYTISGEATAEFTVKRSRFIADLCHVETADAAKEFLRRQKKKYYDARHNPYAYVLGKRMAEQKSGDDGEPAGTAGSPILEAIIKNQLTDIIIVVTRYFGGIKLGAGGLARAYNQGAVLGIAAAQIMAVCEKIPLRLTVEYALLSTVEHWTAQRNIAIQDTAYGENVTLTLLLPPEDAAKLEGDIVNITAGRAQTKKLSAVPVLLPVER